MVLYSGNIFIPVTVTVSSEIEPGSLVLLDACINTRKETILVMGFLQITEGREIKEVACGTLLSESSKL